MDTREAKKVLVQFDKWINAARRLREVVDAAEEMEQRAKEAEAHREKAQADLDKCTAELDEIRAEMRKEKDKAREFKILKENEAKRLQEKVIKIREEVDADIRAAQERHRGKIDQLEENIAAVERDCQSREKAAREAAEHAEKQLQDLKKRLGGV